MTEDSWAAWNGWANSQCVFSINLALPSQMTVLQPTIDLLKPLTKQFQVATLQFQIPSLLMRGLESGVKIRE
jgi:hypothetical protein